LKAEPVDEKLSRYN